MATSKEMLEQIFNEKRAYSAYFDFRGDREGTEIGVVRDWLDARYQGKPSIYSSIRHCKRPDDPPDVILVTISGERHGVEVTEFVDADTARKAESGDSFSWKEYGEAEFRKAVEERISRKAGKAFKNQPYSQTFLVLYSDEPDLFNGDAASFLIDLRLSLQSPFTEIWFMIPPEVNISGGEPSRPYCQIFRILCE